MKDALRIFVRGLRLGAEIGLHPHERGRAQPLRIDITLDLDPAPVRRIGDTVDYDRLAEAARALATAGHIDLVETFAEHLADACLKEKGARAVTVRVEKSDAIADAACAGVELVRFKSS